jgi:hypothetical protein
MYLSNDKGTSNLHFCRENVALIHRAAAKPDKIFSLMAVGISLRIPSATVAKGFFMLEKQCRRTSCCPSASPRSTTDSHCPRSKRPIHYCFSIFNLLK